MDPASTRKTINFPPRQVYSNTAGMGRIFYVFLFTVFAGMVAGIVIVLSNNDILQSLYLLAALPPGFVGALFYW